MGARIEEYPSDMLGEVIEWICTVDMQADEIADKTGVNKWWIDRMRRGAIPDPGIRRLQKVHDYIHGINARGVAMDVAKLADRHNATKSTMAQRRRQEKDELRKAEAARKRKETERERKIDRTKRKIAELNRELAELETDSSGEAGQQAA